MNHSILEKSIHIYKPAQNKATLLLIFDEDNYAPIEIVHPNGCIREIRVRSNYYRLPVGVPPVDGRCRQNSKPNDFDSEDDVVKEKKDIFTYVIKLKSHDPEIDHTIGPGRSIKVDNISRFKYMIAVNPAVRMVGP
ncbi:MAG: hypothetical protein C0490_19960 [Marivirga sp.]|nr:hypothetical protein [Marivirga sp.]